MLKKNKNFRFRFAPSPTGFLHIGNLRTALFGYLLAKSSDGKFILRIEDTDEKREMAGAVEGLIQIMDWSGVNFDEGPHLGGPYAPYTQSQRIEKYKELTQELLAKDGAYYCFCTSERLEEMRKKQTLEKEAPRYDRCCRELSPTEIEEKLKNKTPYVLRQKMPLVGEIKVYDEIRGEIVFSAKDLDDHVLIKSNGVPTYQFANIVDDHLMEITHVTRGDEWLASFPKNILLYQAFGWEAPKFIHFPLIMNKGGGKLSKRQGDVFVENYRQAGYLPEALINFCALLGWHGSDDQELYTLQKLEKTFNFQGLQKSPAIFDLEKLDYLNSYYLRQKSLTELVSLCHPYLPEIEEELLKKLIIISQDRMKKLSDIKESAQILEKARTYEKELLFWKENKETETKKNLQDLEGYLESLTSWEIKDLEEKIISWIKSSGQGNGDYLWPLRVALSGQKNSPSPFELAWLLGKEESLRRIKEALEKL